MKKLFYMTAYPVASSLSLILVLTQKYWNLQDTLSLFEKTQQYRVNKQKWLLYLRLFQVLQSKSGVLENQKPDINAYNQSLLCQMTQKSRNFFQDQIFFELIINFNDTVMIM